MRVKVFSTAVSKANHWSKEDVQNNFEYHWNHPKEITEETFSILKKHHNHGIILSTKVNCVMKEKKMFKWFYPKNFPLKWKMLLDQLFVIENK
jgi:hypothetical protein